MDEKIFLGRRKDLLGKIRAKYIFGGGSAPKRGVLLLCADFEDHKKTFLQESSFYYFTGVKEPGVVYALFFDEKEDFEILFVPDYGIKREDWTCNDNFSSKFKTMPLGEKVSGYWLSPFFDEKNYSHLIEKIKTFIGGCTSVGDGVSVGGSVSFLFALLDQKNANYFSSVYILKNMFRSGLKNSVEEGNTCDDMIDISSIVASMRRKKDEQELFVMQKAIDITCKAHEKVAQIIKPGLHEHEIRAEIEKVFVCNEAEVAFPSIVATGKNTTILHYGSGNKKLLDGDLLVVDIGARVDGYCADVTRTYAVSKTFSPRQKEIYQIVLDVQNYIASLVKPGFYLSNESEPKKSLQHLALDFLDKYGYKKYFIHGIGHFLGLDVHDVGDRMIPLEPGDVITIEPGIYLPEENLGVRIEDDFVIKSDGCSCLSPNLAKKIPDVEAMR